MHHPITTPVEIKERVTYFIRLLKENHGNFNNRFQAYSHIAKALYVTEVTHHCIKNRMCILPFTDFFFDCDFRIYYRETINQSILIHHNGAYGIFQNSTKNCTAHLQEYKDRKHPELIHVPNSFGTLLW